MRVGRGLWANSLTVVNYHRIDDPTRPGFDSFKPNISATPRNFDRQLTYLKQWFNVISVDDLVAHVAAVGDGMRGTTGIAATVFAAVSGAKVNVEAIAQGSSECNISFAVEEKDRVAAVRALHAALAGGA